MLNLHKLIKSSGVIPAVLAGIAFSLPAHAQVYQASLPYNVSLLKEAFAEQADTGSPAPLNGTASVTPYWVDLVNAEANNNGGDGNYVAVLDTGLLENWADFFPHAKIKTEWGKGFTHDIWWDDTIGDLMAGPLLDDRGFITDLASGHGTHVASTIVGYHFKTATADLMVRGVAPQVTIIPVLVLDGWEVTLPDGEVLQLSGGFDDMISAGIRYIADLAVEQHIKIVINMSLGGPEPTAEIEDAIDYAIARGVIIVASAGNAGTDGMGWPGAYPQVISAAAGGWTQQWIPVPPQTRWWLNNVTEKLNTKDLLWNNWQTYLEEFSSRPNPLLGQSWKELDVCAPGASIVGPYKSAFANNTSYYYLWGTSMAAPHVTGLAATLAQLQPGIMQSQAELVLKNAATGLPLPVDGANVFDPFVGDLYHFAWGAHDFGTGWLTWDKIVKTAATRTK